MGWVEETLRVCGGCEGGMGGTGGDGSRGAGGGGTIGEGGGGEACRPPQSVQSVVEAHRLNSEPGPPSSQTPSFVQSTLTHESVQVRGGGGLGGRKGGGDGGGGGWAG